MRIDQIHLYRCGTQVLAIPRREDFLGLATLLNEWNHPKSAKYLLAECQKVKDGIESEFGVLAEEEYDITFYQDRVQLERRPDSDFGVKASLHYLETEDVTSIVEEWVRMIEDGNYQP